LAKTILGNKKYNRIANQRKCGEADTLETKIILNLYFG
jgi:hypothetical protein